MNGLIRSRGGRVIIALACCMIMITPVFFGLRESRLIMQGQFYRNPFDWTLLGMYALLMLVGAWTLLRLSLSRKTYEG